jgi:hypothetical protein
MPSNQGALLRGNPHDDFDEVPQLREMKRNTPSDRERHEVIEEHDRQLFTTSLNAVQMFAGPFASTRKALIQNRESSGGKKKVQRKSRFREKMNHYHDSAEAILSSSSAIRLSPSQIWTCGFPASGKASTTINISWLNHTPRMTADYASNNALPRGPQDSLPACQLRLWLDGTFTCKMSLAFPSALTGYFFSSLSEGCDDLLRSSRGGIRHSLFGEFGMIWKNKSNCSPNHSCSVSLHGAFFIMNLRLWIF